MLRHALRAVTRWLKASGAQLVLVVNNEDRVFLGKLD